nr:ulp1 protease family, C-terminal catalytic domain-containing protein [Tanacetum cinerariifolium]
MLASSHYQNVSKQKTRVSSILVAILSLSHSSPSYLRTAISNYGKIVINGDDDNDDGNGNNNEELNVDNEDGNNGEELNVDNDDGNGNKDGKLNDINDDGNGNNDEELNDEDTLGGNPSFGFSKIRLDDFEKQPSQEGTDAKKESGDLFGDNSVRMEVSNQGSPTLDRMSTRASNASASPGKQIVKPSSYLLSPYMNKKTKVVSKITRMEFSVGNISIT